jgi:hypothetical protein
MHARGAKRVEEANSGRTVYLLEHRAHAMGAVVFSIAALEAAINELFTDAAEGNLHNLRPLDEVVIKRLGTMWLSGVPRTASYRVVDKFAIALHLADRDALDASAEPWQSAMELAKLRNALIHYEPEWVPMPVTGEAHKFEKSLRGKFPENPLAPSENAYYPDKLLGHGCAAWAVHSALAFAGAFSERLGIFGNLLGGGGAPELATE